MNKTKYKDLIKSLNVEENPKYLLNHHTTFCNFFAQDFCKLTKTPLPSGTCNDMTKKLPSSKNWKKVDYKTACKNVNEGIVSVAITHDHIVVVRPSSTEPTSIGKVRISQAGYKNFEDTTLSYAWQKDRFDEIKFYSWNI